jgi:rubrerythrin
MSAMLALGIVSVFAFMFVGVVVAVMWFTHASSKVESKKEIQKKKIDVLEKHFNEIIRIECPYCRTLYSSNEVECPNCGANTKKILFPEMLK